MFEADPNLWLQSFSAPWLLWLMTLVSELGTTTFYMAAFLLLAFGMKLRPMLGVLLALVLAGSVTNAIKLGFALPRPSEVDARVLDKGEAGHAVVADGAAETFWGLPAQEATAAVRALGEMDYGFVSGHASAATAFALGIVLFFGFRQRWAWAVAVGWALLMGLSRMFLGRHFLGDVLGGWIVGGLAVWLAWIFTNAMASDSRITRKRGWTAMCVTVATLFLLSLVVPFITPGAVGQIAGALACLFVVTRAGYPDESGIVHRILRVALAFALGFGLDSLLARLWEWGGWTDQHPVSFLFTAIGYPLAILGTFFIARWLRLYREPAATPVGHG